MMNYYPWEKQLFEYFMGQTFTGAETEESPSFFSISTSVIWFIIQIMYLPLTHWSHPHTVPPPILLLLSIFAWPSLKAASTLYRLKCLQVCGKTSKANRCL